MRAARYSEDLVLTDPMLVRLAAIAAAAGFLVIAAFQVALVLGAPLGRAAWGGAADVLPARLRVASAVATAVWLVATALVLGRAGMGIVPLPAVILAVGSWALVVLLAVGALLNFASSSRWERFFWAPFSVLLALLTLIVALPGTGSSTG